MKTLLLGSLVLFSLLGACAHRPYYRELVGTMEPASEPVAFRVVDPQSGEALSGVTVRFGEARARTVLTTGKDGVVRLPRNTVAWQDNPVVEVDRPTAGGYRLVRVDAPPAATP